MSVHQEEQCTTSIGTPPIPCPRLAIDLPPCSHSRNQSSNQSSSCAQITISWKISRRAITAHAPPGPSPTLQLKLTIKPTDHAQRFQTTWSLTDPKSNKQTSLPQSEHCQITRPEGYICIQSADLCCVIRNDSASNYTLIYARTKLFNTLHIPGGRYHTTGCKVVHAE